MSSCTTLGASSSSSCDSGTFLQTTPGPSSCVSTYPTGKYPSSSDNTCKLCDPTCHTCLNSGASQCITCASTLFFQAANGPIYCLPKKIALPILIKIRPISHV